MLLVGLMFGLLAGWWVRGLKVGAAAAVAAARSEAEMAAAKTEQSRLLEHSAALEQRVKAVQQELEAANQKTRERAEEAAGAFAVQKQLRERLEERQSEVQQLLAQLERMRRDMNDERGRLHEEMEARKARISALQMELQNERVTIKERLQDLDLHRKETSEQFRELATQIVEERTRAFRESNQTTIEGVLTPLREQLKAFGDRMEVTHSDSLRERTTLVEQVRQLMELNRTVSQEAHNLTTALKGESRTRGAWGEMILERILEAGGLKKDVHYRVQVSVRGESGQQQRPDVVIDLPENRRLVVDAKVSLVGYQEYTEAQTDEERQQAIRRHAASVRRHVQDLSGKDYSSLDEVSTVDFVIMFVPIEPAFLAAIQCDAALWEFAWKSRVLMVSPSTLLFVVRTVAHLWTSADQQKHAGEIARQAGQMYDKLAQSLNDFEKVKKSLDSAGETFQQAYARLYTGKGNVSRQAEQLRALGVKTSKTLPAHVIQALGTDEVDTDDDREGSAD